MGKTVKLRKGYDIKIKGTPQKKVDAAFTAKTYAVKPPDFIGNLPIPKLLVKVGDEVLAGQPLFFDKRAPKVMYTSPVSGEVVEIKRGDKRAITEIIILADTINKYKSFDRIVTSKVPQKKIVDRLLESGCWPFLRQRPYNIIAEPTEKPRDIFISGFDSAPLAPDYNFMLNGQLATFQTGINVLQKLTDGKIYLGVDGNSSINKTFTDVKGVEMREFKGKHPAGCVGVQIHNTAPINKGDIVWTIDPQDVLAIGRVFREGKFDTTRYVAVAGPPVKNPQYVKTYLGANIAGLLKDNLATNHVRIVSGDVLTGKQIDTDGHLHFFDNQISVIEEGDKYELFGWLIPNYLRPSLSRTFPAFLMPNKEYDVNTNTHGEHRAFVVTGLYEKVLPMDLYPMQLLKSIMYRDFDQMEGLGIYEVVEEDLALCEFVCPSKSHVQAILRDGLDYMREQA